LLLPVIIVAITALCLGYDAGVMSGAIGPIRRSFELTDVEEGIAMGCINVIAAPGALLGGKLADWLGRANSVAGTAFLLIAGPALVASSQGFPQLFAGRLVTGVGVGFSFVLAPLYAAEVSPPSIRAGIVTVTEILINAGVMLGYLSALALDDPNMPANMGWRIVTGLAAAPALLTLCAFPCLPESPRWLLQAGRQAEAEAVLERLCPNPEVKEDALRSMEEAVAEEALQDRRDGWSEIFCPSPVVRRMLLAGLGVAFFQQISGSEAIVYYTPTILGNFGLHSASDQNMGALAVGGAKLFGACLGAVFLDCAGRRAGVLVSCIGVASCLVGLAALQGFDLPSIGLPLLCTFMIFFEIGLAPAAFVLGTECYPVAIRAKALGLGMFTTRFLSGLVAVLFPSIVRKLSLTTCLWAFATFACIGVVWAFFCVPETRGLTLEEVARLFETSDGIWSFRPALPGDTFAVEDSESRAGVPKVDIERTPLQS
jgi:sugar porter (SP) family MFS transporter